MVNNYFLYCERGTAATRTFGVGIAENEPATHQVVFEVEGGIHQIQEGFTIHEDLGAVIFKYFVVVFG